MKRYRLEERRMMFSEGLKQCRIAYEALVKRTTRG